MTRRARGLLVLSTLILALSPAWALRIPGRSPADRASAQPLRDIDLAAVLDGSSPATPAWRAAADRIPERCRREEAVRARECNEDLRGSWLLARAGVVAAWSGKGRVNKDQAASFLHRVADRLAAESGCGRGVERQQRWRDDTAQAARDDALVHVALLLELRSVTRPVLEPDAEKALRAVLVKAERGGVASLEPVALARHRAALRRAWERKSWLAAQPNLVRVADALEQLWSPAGGIPEGCGRKLTQPKFYQDQWRGFLVREAVPQAMACIKDRLPSALARRGKAPKDAEEGRVVAEVLATVASRDSGGRRFGHDGALAARVDALTEAYRATTPTQTAKRSGGAKSSPKKARRTSSSTRGKRPSAKSGSRKATPEASGSKRGGPVDVELVKLASRVDALVGADGELVAAARAHGQQATKRLVVTLHREVCKPLEKIDLDDLDQSRRVLAEIGASADEDACKLAQGKNSLREMLEAASGLRRLAAVGWMRMAARQVVRERPDLARETLERVAREYRGSTWTLLYAWAARRDGDPVTADRMLAHVDEGTLDRLRASGHEEVARVVAHAWVSAHP